MMKAKVKTSGSTGKIEVFGPEDLHAEVEVGVSVRIHFRVVGRSIGPPQGGCHSISWGGGLGKIVARGEVSIFNPRWKSATEERNGR